jgi:uncharacterized protein (TIGR02594 family)
MPTEYESLRLSVSLVDNVSHQIEKIKGSLAGLGGGQAGSGMDRLKRQTAELTQSLKGLSGGFASGSEAALSFAKAGGLATAGVVAMGVALVKGIGVLKEYAAGMQALGRLAEQTGIGAGQLKNMSEALQQSGLNASQAQTNLSGLAHAMADIGRANSQLRQTLLAGLGGSDRAAMEALLGDLGKVANNPAAFANRVRQALDEVYDGVLQRTKSTTRAAEVRQRFAEAFGMPDLAEFRGKFSELSAAQQTMWDQRIRQAREFQQVTTDISQSWSRIGEAVNAMLLPAATKALEAIAPALSQSAEQIERAATAIANLKPPEWLSNWGAQLKKEGEAAAGALNAVNQGAVSVGAGARSAVGSAVGGVRGWFHRQSGGMAGSGSPYMVGEAGPELFVPGQSGHIIPNLQGLRDFFTKPAYPFPGREFGEAHPMAMLKSALTSAGVLPPMARGIWEMLRATPAETGELPPQYWPRRALGGPVSAGSRYLVGEQGPEMFMPGGGSTGGEGVRLIGEQNRQTEELNRNTEDQNEQTRDLVQELRKLNDSMTGRVGGGGGPSFSGLGGLPGFGGGGGGGGAGAYVVGGSGGGGGGGAGAFTGGGSASRGGGATGSWVGTDVGPGVGAGAGGGGGSQGGPGQSTPGAPGDDMAPAQALAYARTHLGENEVRDQSKLSSFFRSQGIKINPATTAWCAAFVNANLSQAGIKGTGSLAAGSFLKWGKGVSPDEVRGGDVAVVKGYSPRSGMAASHVAFATGETRMGPGGEKQYQLLGGNQSNAVTDTNWVAASKLAFRRAPGSEGGGGGAGAYVGGGGSSGGGGATGAWTSSAGTTGGSGKAAAEAYFGKSISSGEYDALVRATHAESGARNSPEEQAMIMGSILNRARTDRGGIMGALNAPNQFQSVTGTRFAPGPSRNYRLGPNASRSASIEAAAGMLGRVSRSQRDFTAASHAAYGPGTNIGYLSKLERTGGSVYGGTQFGTSLTPERRELDRDMGREVAHRVEGTGKLTVDVNAPAGTRVAAEGGGLFKKVETNRQTQMAPASQGPSAPS